MAFPFANSWLYEMKGTDRSRYEEDGSSRDECHQSESDIDEDRVTDEFSTSDEEGVRWDGSFIELTGSLHHHRKFKHIRN